MVGPYVVDFLCHANRLIIELDGSVHDAPAVQAHDIGRRAALEAAGYTVLRFPNSDVDRDLARVLDVIRGHLGGD